MVKEKKPKPSLKTLNVNLWEDKISPYYYQPLLPFRFSGMAERAKYTESFASATLNINLRKLQIITRINSAAYEFLEAEVEWPYTSQR